MNTFDQTFEVIMEQIHISTCMNYEISDIIKYTNVDIEDEVKED